MLDLELQTGHSSHVTLSNSSPSGISLTFGGRRAINCTIIDTRDAIWCVYPVSGVAEIFMRVCRLKSVSERGRINSREADAA